MNREQVNNAERQRSQGTAKTLEEDTEILNPWGAESKQNCVQCKYFK